LYFDVGDALVQEAVCSSRPREAPKILDRRRARGVVHLGEQVMDWRNPFSKTFRQILAVIAEFKLELIRQRTREGDDRASSEAPWAR